VHYYNTAMRLTCCDHTGLTGLVLYEDVVRGNLT
jgi:hypothetical protein